MVQHCLVTALTLPPRISSRLGIIPKRINSLALETYGSFCIDATAVTLPFLAWYVANYHVSLQPLLLLRKARLTFSSSMLPSVYESSNPPPVPTYRRPLPTEDQKTGILSYLTRSCGLAML
jgi:hypothetical protein